MRHSGTQRRAGVVDSHTFQITSGHARLTLTFTRSGHMVTTHEYDSALVKRVSVSVDHEEIQALSKWLIDNLAIKPYPPLGRPE